jgi:tripartite-type tricarboxylate transporter receptor subunit TctC
MKPSLKRVLAACALLCSTTLHAQSWPADKPVRMVVGFPPGGGVDVVARIVAQRLSEVLKQQIVVDNRAGANGTIGADHVAKSAPDGYTILMASTAEVVAGPAAGQKTPYDPEADLVPVVLVGETPVVVVAHPSVPASDLAGLVSHVKANAGRIAYASPGNGSEGHFAGEALQAITGAAMQHVPYRGGAPALNDIAGNQVPVGLVGLPPVVSFAKSGRVKVLAVGTSQRSRALPDVPSASETPGLKDYRFTIWMAMFAPVRTPAAVVERLAAEVAKLTQEPGIREKLAAIGVEPLGLTGPALAAFLQAERQSYRTVARSSGIRIDN